MDRCFRSGRVKSEIDRLENVDRRPTVVTFRPNGERVDKSDRSIRARYIKTVLSVMRTRFIRISLRYDRACVPVVPLFPFVAEFVALPPPTTNRQIEYRTRGVGRIINR